LTVKKGSINVHRLAAWKMASIWPNRYSSLG
jgi:hypothetical protein